MSDNRLESLRQAQEIAEDAGLYRQRRYLERALWHFARLLAAWLLLALLLLPVTHNGEGALLLSFVFIIGGAMLSRIVGGAL